MIKKLHTLLIVVLLYSAQAFAQVNISGTVIDAETGEGLPGASVVLTEINRGTATGVDGSYTITGVNAGNYTLVATFVGYERFETTISVGNQDINLNIQLRPSVQALSDVIVTAFGITRDEKSIGYAVQKVGSEDINRVSESNLVGALSGKVSGIQVIGTSGANIDGSQKIRIRGVNGLSDGQPLFIVDGTPISNRSFSTATRGRDFGSLISDLNLQDIDNVSVLKGAAASALYGNRASNGVIIITTKKGGNSDKPGMQVEYAHNTTFEEVYILPEYQNQYAGGYTQEFLKVTPDGSTLYDNGAGGWELGNGTPWTGTVQNALNYAADESWGPKMDGSMYRPWWSWYKGSDFTGDGVDDYGTEIPLKSNPNNVRDFFNTGVSTSHSLTVSGGNSSTSYRASYRNLAVDGVMPGSELAKNYLSFSGALRHTEKFTSQVSANYSNSKTLGRPAQGYSPQAGNPLQSFNQWFQRQLDMKKLKKYRQPGGLASWNIRSATDTRPLYWDSPYFSLLENRSEDSRNRLFGKYELTYNLLPSLALSTDLNVDTYDFTIEDRTATGGLEQDSYSIVKRSRTEVNYGAKARFEKDLGSIYLSVLAGGNVRTEDYNSVSNSTAGGLSIPDFYNIAASSDRPNTSSYKEEVEVRSVFGTATLGLGDIIYVDASLRNDWSSALPANDNAYLYYSLSTSLVFTELGFLKNQDFLSFGKLRASFAQVGDEIAPYLISQTYSSADNYGSDPAQTVPNALANPELTAAISTDYELGTEFRFFKGNLRLDLTYYQTLRENEILSLEVPGSSGYSTTIVNAGEFETKGYEGQLGLTLLKTRDMMIDFNLNLATSESKVIKLAEGLTARSLESAYFGVRLYAREGEKWGQAVTTGSYGGYTYHENGKKIVNTANGTYVRTNNKDLGTITPDFTGGLSSTIRIKDLSIGFLIDFQKGGQFYSITKMFNAYAGLGKQTVGNNVLGNPLRDPIYNKSGNEVDFINLDDAAINSGGVLVEGVDEDGNEVKMLKDASNHFGTQFRNKEDWMFDASFVKLREVNVTYQLPNFLVQTLPISRASIGVELRNPLLLYASTSGVDPSIIQNGTTGFSFWEGGGLPGTRSVGFNVNVTF